MRLDDGRPEAPHGLRSLALPLLAAALGALAGCQQQAPTPEGAVQVSPAAVRAAPGEQVQFSVQSPWGTDVTWSVSPPAGGTITQGGLFTAASDPGQAAGTCTVVATLRSDTTRVGLAVVLVQVEPPVNAVVAAGQQQSADGVAVESVLAEPVSSVVARDATGAVENRSGFYPSGNPNP